MYMKNLIHNGFSHFPYAGVCPLDYGSGSTGLVSVSVMNGLNLDT